MYLYAHETKGSGLLKDGLHHLIRWRVWLTILLLPFLLLRWCFLLIPYTTFSTMDGTGDKWFAQCIGYWVQLIGHRGGEHKVRLTN